VLRDQTEALCSALEVTTRSRAEYDLSHLLTGEPLEDARRFVVRCWQAHASDLARKTGRKSRAEAASCRDVAPLEQSPQQLQALAFRLKDAEFENREAREVIARHRSADCLIYADPPYPDGVRTQHLYGDKWTTRTTFACCRYCLSGLGRWW
jgi:DNA adenine methylase